jgi:hypothetical protein
VASTYGWVTILLYCLWLNEHIHYFLTIVTTAAMEDFSSKFDKDFSLVTLVSSVSSGRFGGGIRWIVDSGASSHMMGI